MKIDKKVIITIVVAVLVISFIVLGVKLLVDRQVETQNVNLDEEIESTNENNYIAQIDYCLRELQRDLVGEWRYMGGEASPPPYLILTDDGDFTLYDWVEESYSISGKWVYIEEGEIKLKFSELDKYWEDLLSDDPTQYFDGVVEYNIDQKEIAFKLGYFQRHEDFTGDCLEDRFYIDLFNVYLYKVED